jgi:hypothetical protein
VDILIFRGMQKLRNVLGTNKKALSKLDNAHLVELAGTGKYARSKIKFLAQPSKENSNSHRLFSPSRVVPAPGDTPKKKPHTMVRYFLWWSWRVLPPRPLVYLASLSYRLRSFGYCKT